MVDDNDNKELFGLLANMSGWRMDSNMEEEDPETRRDTSAIVPSRKTWPMKRQSQRQNRSPPMLTCFSLILEEHVIIRQSRHTCEDSGNVQLGLISLSVFGTIWLELGWFWEEKNWKCYLSSILIILYGGRMRGEVGVDKWELQDPPPFLSGYFQL